MQLLRDGVLHLHMLRIVTWLLSRFGTANLWLVYRKDLTKPLTSYAAKVSTDIGRARKIDMGEVAALSHAKPQRAARRARWFRERLRNGDHCFIARIDGVIAACNWIRVNSAVGIRGEEMRLNDDEIYTTDAYTARAWRGKGIHTALNYAMLQYAQDKGYRTAYTMLRLENTRSWITMLRVGWEHSGTLLYFRPDRARDAMIWRIGGSAYPMPIKSRKRKKVKDQRRGYGLSNDPISADVAEAEALRWVRRHFSFDRCKIIRDWRWAKTYRLTNNERVAYLKIVPHERAGVLQAAVFLARASPNKVPTVVACDHQRGWQVTLDHGGAKLDYEAPEEHLLKLIETYALLQAQAVSDPDLMGCLPKTNVSQMLPELLDFLRFDGSAATTAHHVGADYFLGSKDARNYYKALTRRRALLQQHMASASRLAETLNHGDLRPTKAAMKASGDCVLYDWDDATAGPAGLSLHALFSGCLKPTLILADDHSVAVEDGFHRQLLDRYIKALAGGGYADECTLRQCLPASITVGLIQYILNFTKYATDSPRYREIIRKNIKKRLWDLLDLCDYLSSKDRQTALDFSLDYKEVGHLRRAKNILENFLAAHPHDAIVKGRLATILTEQGRLSKAQEIFRQALELNADQAELHNGLGLTLLKEMEFIKAAACFQRALKLDPSYAAARDNADQALRLQHSSERIRLLNKR